MSFKVILKILISIILISILYPKQYLFGQNAENPDVQINITLKDVRLDQALSAFNQKTGKNFIPASPEIAVKKISLILNQVSIDDAISIFMETNKLGYRQKSGTNIFLVDDISTIMTYTEIQSVPCEFAEAKKMVEVLSKIITPGVGSVFCDERTNTIIIRESPRVIRDIIKLIKELDKPTRQIYIQAAIVEISLTDNLETGVEWLWNNPIIKGGDSKVGTSFGINNKQTSIENSDLNQNSNGSAIPFPFSNGLGFGVIKSNLEVVIHALKTEYEVELLSRPKIITLDNEEAIIEVGDQIPYQVLTAYGNVAYEFKNATIRLLVKPHINNDKTITLYLEPSADYQNGVTPNNIPIIAMRKTKTNVKVENGSTIVIGGLIQSFETKTKSKVPILGSIPIIGKLFSKDITKKEKKELVLFITPVILDDDNIAGSMKNDFKILDKVEKKD